MLCKVETPFDYGDERYEPGLVEIADSAAWIFGAKNGFCTIDSGARPSVPLVQHPAPEPGGHPSLDGLPSHLIDMLKSAGITDATEAFEFDDLTDIVGVGPVARDVILAYCEEVLTC